MTRTDVVHRPLRSPRVASLVADTLRERILLGEIADGERLPKEDTLREEFGVGKPAMREAFRILETEGFIHIVRGNQGGAVADAPRIANSAYAIGLVLTARRVKVHDLGEALRLLDPLCGALCARRPDRESTVIPALRAVQAEAERAVGQRELTSIFRRFHEQMVASCGNETLILVVGALEALWSSRVTATALSSADPGTERSARDVAGSKRDHDRVIALIEAGDDEGVQSLLRSHIERVQRIRTSVGADELVNMVDIRQRLGL